MLTSVRRGLLPHAGGLSPDVASDSAPAGLAALLITEATTEPESLLVIESLATNRRIRLRSPAVRSNSMASVVEALAVLGVGLLHPSVTAALRVPATSETRIDRPMDRTWE